MRWLEMVATSLLVAVVAAACGGAAGSNGNGKPRVVAAFYPLEFVAGQVGGDRVQVESLTPSGVEPHDLELSSQQVQDLAEAELVVYIGHGFQPAVEDVVASVEPDHRLDALEGRELLAGTEEDAEPAQDPHIWLDPTIMASLVESVATRLTELDPDGAQSYRVNADDLQARLLSLDEEYSKGLSSCRLSEFVTSHAAFGYLAERYGLEQVSIAGIDPEAEPSPARLAQVARFVDEHGVTTIFFEELAPPDLAETLARETGARTDVLSPLESAPEQGDYVDAMRTNLTHLRAALDCE